MLLINNKLCFCRCLHYFSSKNWKLTR